MKGLNKAEISIPETRRFQFLLHPTWKNGEYLRRL